MTNNSNLLFKVEQDIANLLIDKLEYQEITFERASLIAKFILIHLPKGLTDEQVIQLLPSLDDEFIELAVVVHKYMSEYEAIHSKILTDQMTDLIKHKHFDRANQLASKYLGKKFM
ncbi:MAG: hypothetical protein ACMG6E_09495 [Candidatus Roizmanbacteria bacterium]